MGTDHDGDTPTFTFAFHFQIRLWERYKLVLTESEIQSLKQLVRDQKIEQVSDIRLNHTAVFKYIHKPNTTDQQRIYIVAEVGTGNLVTVEKAKWRHARSNKPTRQKTKDAKGRSKRTIY